SFQRCLPPALAGARHAPAQPPVSPTPRSRCPTRRDDRRAARLAPAAGEPRVRTPRPAVAWAPADRPRFAGGHTFALKWYAGGQNRLKLEPHSRGLVPTIVTTR